MTEARLRSSSSDTRGTPEGRSWHASFTRAKYGLAVAVMSPTIAISSTSDAQSQVVPKP